jgi:hypothetical protein
MDEPMNEMPTPEEVRAQVERMSASAEFRRAPQLAAFLRYVVEAVLQGEGDRIRAHTIGVEVLRRDAKFDPRRDPVVQVEANRLRRTIDRYYATAGANDRLRINLPRGSYVPSFRRRSGKWRAPARLPAVQLPGRGQSARSLLAVAIAVIIFALVAAVLYRPKLTPEAAPNAPPSPLQNSIPSPTPRP